MLDVPVVPQPGSEPATSAHDIMNLTAKVDGAHKSKSRSCSTSSKHYSRCRSTSTHHPLKGNLAADAALPPPAQHDYQRQDGSRRTSRSRSCRRSASTRHSPRRHSPRKDTGDQASRKEADTTLLAQYPAKGNLTGKKLPRCELSLEPYRCLPPDLKKKANER